MIALLRKAIAWMREHPRLAVAAWAVFVGVAIGLLERGVTDACKPLPVSLIRVEVAFGASHFTALLGAERDCRAIAIAQLGGWDFLFAAAYPGLIVSLFGWAQRWRERSSPHATGPAGVPSVVYRIVAYCALSAGLFDWLEDICLSIAASRLSAPHGAALPGQGWLVGLGSLAALAKWVLIGVCLVALILEIIAGPRGRVLRLTRFSALAVALGALPLLVLPQGEDLLQRLAESPTHPFVFVISAAFAIFFTALVSWYAARRLLQQPFDARPKDDDSERWRAWFEHYATQLPRFLGTATLFLGGFAFARAGFATGVFMTATIAAVVAISVIESWYARRRASSVGANAQLFASIRESLQADGLRARVAEMLVSIFLSMSLFLFDQPRSPLPLDESVATVYALRTGAVACLVLGWFLFLFVRYRRNVLAFRSRASTGDLPALRRAAYALPRYSPRSTTTSLERTLAGTNRRSVDPELAPSNKAVVVVAALLSAASLVLLTIASPSMIRTVGPVWVLALFASNAVFVGSIAVFVYERTRIPLVRVAIGFALVFGLWNENHAIRRLENTTDARVPIDSFYRRWTNGQGGPVVVVAAAGGGLRAAYWTAISLAALADRVPSFVGRTFAISGVSGGSVGAALFTAIVRDSVAIRATSPCVTDSSDLAAAEPYSRCVRRFFRDDHLTPVLAKMVGPDFAQRFWPYPLTWADRSLGLERSWEQSYASMYEHNTFAQSFEALGTRDSARVPALFLNTTSVETGKRYVESTVAFADWLLDTRDVLSLLRSDIRVSTAAHNSARFTYVSPAGHLDRGDSVELGRIVDGGYFENSGLVTAGEIVAHLRAAAAPVLVVYLCNDPGACHTPAPDSLIRNADSLAQTKSTFVNELLSPVRALLATRDARGQLASAETYHSAGVRYFQLNVCDHLTMPDTAMADANSATAARAREQVVSPPLGWSLSRLARRWMDASLFPAAAQNGTCPQANVRVLDSIAALMTSVPQVTAPRP